MPVHFSPFKRQLHFGSLRDLEHEQESSSKTAVGVGWPLIQSIPNLFSSCVQSCLRGHTSTMLFSSRSSLILRERTKISFTVVMLVAGASMVGR